MSTSNSRTSDVVANPQPMDVVQTSGPNRTGFTLVATGTFDDVEFRLEVRNDKYSINIDGNWENIRTDLFKKFDAKKIVMLGGSVAVVCYALYRGGFSAYDFAPGSLAFKVDVDKDGEENLRRKISSGAFQKAINGKCREAIQEFGMAHLTIFNLLYLWQILVIPARKLLLSLMHLKDYEFAVSVADKSMKENADIHYNFENANITNNAEAAVGEKHETTVQYGAEVTPELLGRGKETTLGQTKHYNFRGATISESVAGVGKFTKATFEAKK